MKKTANFADIDTGAHCGLRTFIVRLFFGEPQTDIRTMVFGSCEMQIKTFWTVEQAIAYAQQFTNKINLPDRVLGVSLPVASKFDRFQP